MTHTYQDLIFTHHAYHRLKQRAVSEYDILQAIKYPDQQLAQPQEKIKFVKTIHQRQFQVMATYRAHERKWLIISVWVKGEDDREPLVWQVLVWPFKAVVWLIGKVFSRKNFRKTLGS